MENLHFFVGNASSNGQFSMFTAVSCVFWGGPVEWDQHDCDFLTEDPLFIDMMEIPCWRGVFFGKHAPMVWCLIWTIQPLARSSLATWSSAVGCCSFLKKRAEERNANFVFLALFVGYLEGLTDFQDTLRSVLDTLEGTNIPYLAKKEDHHLQ